jgi:hypothetical protein
VPAEVVYQLATSLGWQSEVRFPGDLASGNFALELVPAADRLRIAELVATLDQRHFRVVRPKHTETRQLLP